MNHTPIHGLRWRRRPVWHIESAGFCRIGLAKSSETPGDGWVSAVDDLPSVETTVSGPCLLVKVSGAMDHAAQPWVLDRLNQAMAHGERIVVLDLADASFCDSAALNVLIRARYMAENAAVVLGLACVPDYLRRILEMTRADQVLRIFATVADAEAALSS